MSADPKTVKKTDEQWREALSPERYRILREAGTEPAFTGALLHNEEAGLYACGACGRELFKSETKYDSGSGWPSFYDAIDDKAVVLLDDDTHGMRRVEVRCGTCGSHLGHVFDDGPQPTGQRYCMNSLALDFKQRS